ncbi:MAG: ATP-grasp domain-containing protein [Acidobacteriota bacterium]
MSLTWLLEPYIHDEVHAALRPLATRRGHRALLWKDEWLERWPSLEEGTVIFHGSLGTADKIAASSPWNPGAFCATSRFLCSAWYEAASEWLLHREYAFTTVDAFVAAPSKLFSRFGDPEALFVRPDSPLKPFSGRVISRDNVSLEALDHGFYYEDVDLPIVAAPVQNVGREWRYVVASGEVITGSGYSAATRSASTEEAKGRPWDFAAQVATSLPAPEAVFVLDICEVEDELRVIELNPFSGADLYGCELQAIVDLFERLSHRS